MSLNNTLVMEACEDGLWRVCKNTTGRPPSSEKWVHVTGPYFREAPGNCPLPDGDPSNPGESTFRENPSVRTEEPDWKTETNPVLAALKRL